MSEQLLTEQPEPGPPPVATQRKILSWLRDVVETILPALLIVLVVNVFLAQATRVEGQSMEPNIHDDQRLVVEKVSYRFHLPERVTSWCSSRRPVNRSGLTSALSPGCAQSCPWTAR
jgi:signal peptidase I